MKKLAILVLGIVLLVGCKSSVEGEKPEASYVYANKSDVEVLHDTFSEVVSTFTFTTDDDIKYRVFMYDGIESGALFVINETKEKLEVEKLRTEKLK